MECGKTNSGKQCMSTCIYRISGIVGLQHCNLSITLFLDGSHIFSEIHSSGHGHAHDAQESGVNAVSIAYGSMKYTNIPIYSPRKNKLLVPE